MALSITPAEIVAVKEKVLTKINKCFMIVNTFENYPAPKPLLGYKVDVANLTQTLKHLNFEVSVKENLKRNRIIPELKEFLDDNDFDNDDCVAFAIFTHGLEHGQLLGSDEKGIDIETIIRKFTNKSEFLGIPKLFFIQACRGVCLATAVDPDDIAQAGAGARVEEADIFVFYSSFEGYVAYVDLVHGSFFMQALCKVLQAFGGKYPLQKIATKVNELVCTHVTENGKCQASEVRHTLTYDVYLNSDGTYPTKDKHEKAVVKRVEEPKAKESGNTITSISVIPQTPFEIIDKIDYPAKDK